MQLAGQPQAPHIVVRALDSGTAGSSAAERLENLYEAVSEDSFVCVGDIIPTERQEGFLRCVAAPLYLPLTQVTHFGSLSFATVLAREVGCRWRVISSFPGQPQHTLVLVCEFAFGWAAQRPWDSGCGRPAHSDGVRARGADKQAGVGTAAPEQV